MSDYRRLMIEEKDFLKPHTADFRLYPFLRKDLKKVQFKVMGCLVEDVWLQYVESSDYFVGHEADSYKVTVLTSEFIITPRETFCDPDTAIKGIRKLIGDDKQELRSCFDED